MAQVFWRGIGCCMAGLALTLGAVATAQAQSDRTEPLWEVGVGGFAALTPDYPASGAYSLNGLPVPYVIYRGDVVRLGGGSAARIVPVETPRFELGVSLDASFGASSTDNALREGLPDLDPLFEIGPELVINAARFNTGTWREGRLDLVMQGRGVFSLSSEGIGYEGALVEVLARYRQRGILGAGSRLSASAGPIFATESLHDYFYEVPVSAARPGRPAFDASGGYLGTEVTVAMSYPVSDRLTLFGGLAGGIYSGAANSGSALWEKDLNGAVFAGFAFSFAVSERRVAAR